MTRDEVMAEAKRALEAAFPERAESLLTAIERGWPVGDRWSFVLNGRRIHVDKLECAPTYEGVLVGLPTREEVIGWSAARAQRLCNPAPSVHVLTPPMLPTGRMPDHSCVALLRSESLSGDPGSVSRLAVIYFPGDDTHPLDPALFDGLDWPAHARDGITDDGF